MFKKSKEISEKINENLSRHYMKKIEEHLEQNNSEQYENDTAEDSLEEITKILEEDEYQPVGMVVFESLGLCAPLFWLVYNCVMEAWSKLVFNIPLAIVGGILLIVVWKNYFKKRNENKTLQKEKNRGSLLLLLLIIIGVAFWLILAVGMSEIQEYIFAEKGWLFYANSNLSIWLFIILDVAIVCAIIFLILEKFSKNSEWELGSIKFIKKHWKTIGIIVIIISYIAITGVTFVTEDKIVYRNWLHPMGVTYSYEDVTEVKTGYKGGIGSSKGDFYYKARFDGRWISFSETNPNEKVKRYNDTYMEIDEFDQKLMKYHPKKQSSHKNEKNADLEQVYIDRFNRIIDNK